MRYFIGIDGGGSKTNAVLSNESGTVLSRATAGQSNIKRISNDELLSLISGLVADLTEAADIRIEAVSGLCGGFAGASSDDSREHLKQIFDSFFEISTVEIVTDMEIALEGAFPNSSGIVLNSGTGSFSVGRDFSMVMKRAGGWGYALGDEGSGYSIGLSAIKRALKKLDKVEETNGIAVLVCSYFKCESLPDIIDKFYSDKFPLHTIAGFAPTILKAALEGDSDARVIVEHESVQLASLVGSLIKRLKLPQPAPLCFTGSILSKTTVVSSLVTHVLGDSVEVSKPVYTPDIGALLIAMRSADITTEIKFLRKQDKS